MTNGPSRRAVLGGLLAAAACRPGRAAAEGIAPAERAAMAAAATAFLDAQDLPGLSVAIAKDGRLVYREAFGFADRDTGERMTPRHRMRIASISKTLTATAVFALIEQGRLRLDERVFGSGGVLGADFSGGRDQPHLAAITIDHLLTHTVGSWANDASDPMFMDARWSHAELIAQTLALRPLERAPGSAYAYSNFGFCVLGRVIEKLTGAPYDAHVQRTLLTPCGISSLRIAGNTRSERAADEVVYGDDTRRHRSPYGMNVTRMDSHGGWMGSAEDLVRFGIRIAKLPVAGGLLRPETVTTMTTGSTVHPAYARGWRVNAAGNWWHTGSLPGTRTILVRTRSGFTWAALCNGRGGNDTASALDRLAWTMVRTVTRWPSDDLFTRG
ncbi:MAG: beta-lactamase family protein [Alphaproteobacteria bacterium]|nr:beta-lactamase family protein [Alphaproteobacteria bacterium]